MINSVSFQAAQPAAEKKQNKKSHAGTGFVVGALAGAGVSHFGKFDTVSKYKDADAFVSSKVEDIDADTKNVPQEKVANVTTLKAEKTTIENNEKAVATKLETIFGKDAKDEEEKAISEVLKQVEGTPTFDSVKATVLDNADVDLKAKEEELKLITEKASTIANEKNLEFKMEAKDPADAAKKIEIACKVAKDKDGKVTFTKGTEAAKSLEDYSKEVAAERKAFEAKKLLASKLNITKETANADVKVKKSVVKSYLEESSKVVSEEAKTAFDNIKDALPKNKSWGKFAIITGASAVVAALIGAMMKKKEN